MEIKRDELLNWLNFCGIEGIGSSKTLKLLGIFKTFENIYFASYDDLFKTRIFNESMIEQFKFIKSNAESGHYSKFILDVCEKERIKIIPFYSEDYPVKLKNLPDAPLTLYALGNIDLLKGKKIALVGSRESDENAKRWAYHIATELIRDNITIVSGGAKGIDVQAHKAAIDLGGKTICVLGSGLIKLYPAEHREMFEEIKKGGLLLTENPPDRQVDKIALIRRNRIISGISSGVILATSSTKGGSKTQMKIAYNQRIPIFCPKISLNLLPNEGIIEGLKEYGVTEIDNIVPVLEEVRKEDRFLSRQKTL